MKLPLAYYNDPVLRKKAARVDYIDDQLRLLIDHMIETVHAINGIGLAAPQVFQSLSLFVTCVPTLNATRQYTPGKIRIFINPEILSFSEETQTFSEGCLSIPNIYINVTRPSKIKIQATDLHGNRFEEELSGFAATNFMHENDHLHGILITDYLRTEEKKSLKELLAFEKKE